MNSNKVKNFFWKYKYEFLVSIILVFLCYGVVLFPHYSQDTYSKKYLYDNLSMREYITSMKELAGYGRYTYAFFSLIYTFIFKEYVLNNTISNFLSLLAFVGLIMVAYSITTTKEDDKNTKRLCYIASASFFINPLFTDWIIFPECVMFYLIGLLMTLFTVKILYSKMKHAKTIVATLLLLAAVGVYQPVITYFVLFVIIKTWESFLIYLKDGRKLNNLKKILQDIIRAIMMYVVVSGVQIMVVRSSGQKGRSYGNVISNVKMVLSEQKKIWLMENVGNKTFLYVLAFTIMVILLVKLIKKLHTDTQTKRLMAITFFSFFMVFYFSIFVTHIFIEPWISQRTITPFLGGLAFVCIAISKIRVVFGGLYEDSKIEYNIINSTIILFVLFCIYKTNYLETDIFKVNAYDAEISYLVGEKIKNYEDKMGIEVKNIAIKGDKAITWNYPEIFAYCDLNIRAWSKDWSAIGALYFYTGRHLKQTEMKEEIFDQYFNGKDWNNFSEDQLYFDEDTLNIVLY